VKAPKKNCPGAAHEQPDERARERVLLTFTGFHDPFAAAGVAGSEQEGPVLSLLRARTFDRVVLFSTPNTLDRTEETQREIAARHPKIRVEVQHFPLEDPTDYFAILASMRRAFRVITDAAPGATYCIGTASGTPQMHACWVLLAASNEIPATLLHMRNVKFVTAQKPSLMEIDVSRPEFPTVRARIWAEVELDDGDKQDFSHLVTKLGIVGDHPAMLTAIQTAALFARADVPVLILGESGTGKEKIAQLIHHLSDRAARSFVAVNCAAIPKDLAESTLFGHQRGAFTGATSDQPGKFKMADGGTLFLDEVAELPMDAQAKLLRALQDGVIEPLGSGRAVNVNCRVVAATNADLQAAVQSGRFREDLYYRLAVGQVRIPALRDRRSDIPKLAVFFLDEINARLGKPRQFNADALSSLQSHDWPGNVRELRNAVQSAAIVATTGLVESEHLKLQPPSPQKSLDSLPEPHEGFSLDEFISQVRTRLYTRALAATQGNATRAAKLLGCTPQAVLKYQRGPAK
jgi:DNA-binding NtrC family response regulator